MVRSANGTAKPPGSLMAASLEEEQALADVVQRHRPWPDGVRDVKLRFGVDSAGEPAVWIVVVARDELNPSRERITAISDFADKIRSDIRRTGSELWPFVAIEAE